MGDLPADFTLEGLVDNRLNVVSAEEGREVSTMRHSDRDLLDADQARDMAPMPLPDDAAVRASGVAVAEKVPLDWQGDGVRDSPEFAERRACLVRNLLTPAECEVVMASAEAHGLEELLLCGGSKRRCTRVPFKSEELRERLWGRMRPHLDDIVVDESNTHQFLNRGMEGTWVPVGLSPVFRVVKYTPGGHISPHYDGEWVTDDETRSIKTILLYLNSGYKGGATRFLDHRDDNVGTRYTETANQTTRGGDADVIAEVPIETGIAIVFDAKMLHEGTELESDTKWLLRSDIVYHRSVRAFAEDSKRAKALALLNEAEYLEESGRADLAVRNYRAAYKLCPELEHDAA
eukprot:TRINITY_DN16196_c0_g1_i1.p1 TRINITY_DN16196_c0_g1~~TRINITY_DN16196_c0_g1_i1.p1  ORF type:complete len:347 (+),score=117.42 TRINITY_DN16196_c0_g1_i1:40-1080(+)